MVKLILRRLLNIKLSRNYSESTRKAVAMLEKVTYKLDNNTKFRDIGKRDFSKVDLTIFNSKILHYIKKITQLTTFTPILLMSFEQYTPTSMTTSSQIWSLTLLFSSYSQESRIKMSY
jgi:hypothetical protein